MSTIRIGIAELQPSQLYVNEEKLAAVLADLDPGVTLEPVPVKRLDGRTILTDGHTRLLALHLRGERTVLARWETDELDWDAYRICVEWCLDAGVGSISDLKDRVIPADEYAVLWLERCHIMQKGSVRGRKGETA